jgi:thioredoxin-related protein
MKRSFLLPLLAAVALGGSLTNAAFADQNSWTTDFKQAKAEAANQRKSVLLDFTGSDWCPWCMKMDKEVFDQKQFQDFASKNLILVKLDYPRTKELSPTETAQNEQLQQEFRIEGFPTYILLDPSGKEIKRQEGYLRGGPSAFIRWASGSGSTAAD